MKAFFFPEFVEVCFLVPTGESMIVAQADFDGGFMIDVPAGVLQLACLVDRFWEEGLIVITRKRFEKLQKLIFER